MEIQDMNSPKWTYLVNIQMGYVPCRGSVVSHIKPSNIMLSNKVELVKLGLSDNVGYNGEAYSLAYQSDSSYEKKISPNIVNIAIF